MRHALRATRLVCALLFLCGALVQYNDPDPLRWIAMYLSAMGACLAAGRFARSWLLCVLVALAALAWAGLIISGMPTWVPPAQMFEPMETKGGAVEMARESWGLGIIAVIMLGLAFAHRRPVRSAS